MWEELCWLCLPTQHWGNASINSDRSQTEGQHRPPILMPWSWQLVWSCQIHVQLSCVGSEEDTMRAMGTDFFFFSSYFSQSRTNACGDHEPEALGDYNENNPVSPLLPHWEYSAGKSPCPWNLLSAITTLQMCCFALELWKLLGHSFKSHQLDSLILM